MSVSMRDAAGPYQQVNVEVLRVRVHMNNTGWIELPTHAGIYNLLALQNGVDTTIVNTTQFPAGEIDQMRLVLGTHNSVMADNIVYAMSVPSGEESGIKLVGDIPVPANSSFNSVIKNADPLFDSIDVAKHHFDFHTTIVNAPGINKGTGTSFARDLDNQPRNIGITDLGSYEKQ